MGREVIGRSGQTAIEYLLMIMVAVCVVVAVWLFLSSSKQGMVTSTTQTLRDVVISPDRGTMSVSPDLKSISGEVRESSPVLEDVTKGF